MSQGARALCALAALSSLACVRTAARGAEASRAGDASPSAGHIIELTHGHWLIDGRFVAGPRYVVDGTLRDSASSHADSAIDLQGGFVVPPFGEAHNHNVEASSRVDALIARYLHDGVFYVENPNVLPRGRAALQGKVNVPAGVDVTFANGGLTSSGGHPIELVRRNIGRGIWTSADGEGAFYWTIDTRDDLARQWPALVAQRPDFLKVYLLYSDEYARRRADTTLFGWRGLDPALLPEIVARAHAASLRVAAHIETAADFRAAVSAGVDQVAHMPGFRGDEHARLADPAPYTLSDDDARDAARRGVVVVTTLSGAAGIDPAGPDSLTRRALDALHRRNLATLRRAGVRLAVGSDSYADDSKGEVRYLYGLGAFTGAELLALWSHDTPRAIFPDRAVGRLGAGDEASFLVLSCDPLVKFACVDSIRLRVKDGRALSLPAPPGAGATAASARDSASEAAIRAIVAEQAAAWNAGDAAGYAARVSPDVSFTNLFGMVMYGAPAFTARHRDILASFFKGTTKRHVVRRIRFVTPEVAIVDVDNEVLGVTTLPAGVPVPADGVVRTQLMEVFARRDGRWWIEAYHNVDLKPGQPAADRTSRQ